jgi:hypothetical protein
MVFAGMRPFGQNFYCRMFFLTLFAVAVLLASGPVFAAPGGGKGNQPPVIDDQNFNLAEIEPAGSVVGQVIATSEKKNNTLEYTIVGGNPDGLFAIDLQTGELTSTAPLDHEATAAHPLDVEVTDKFGRSSIGLVTVAVDDVNEGPTAMAATLAVLTLSPEGTVVGTVPASDPDDEAPFNTLTYEIIGGNEGGEFQIDPATGELKTAMVLDGDVIPSYDLTIEVTDGGDPPDGAPLSDTATVTVNVLSNIVPSNVSEIDDTNGFTVPGLIEFGRAGQNATILGDVNGDGIDDFVISEAGDGQDVSRLYVVFGTDQGFALEFDLTSLNGTNGFRFDGADINDLTGEAVNGAGDINNDGLVDILIGAPQAFNETNNTFGRAYIVFGGQQFPSLITAADLNGTIGFQIVTEPEAHRLGTTVSLMGDVNGDGIDDVWIASPESDFDTIPQAGRVYVIFGRQSLDNNNPVFEPVIDLSNLSATDGMIFHGAANELAGITLSPTGDINGDGFADVVIGAPGASPMGNEFAGRVYIVFGNLNPLPPLPGDPAVIFDLTTLDGTNGFLINGLNIADNLAGGNGGGDINGDGRSDAVIVAPGAEINGNQLAGAAYIIFGTDTNYDWPTVFDLTSLNGTNGFRILGAIEFGVFGFPADNRSDIDADGFDDIVAGAPVLAPPGTGSPDDPPPPPSFYYLIAGSNQPFSATVDLKILDPSIGSRIEVPASTFAMGAGGDVNHDGAGDFVLGAQSDVTAAGQTGQAYVLFGGIF